MMQRRATLALPFLLATTPASAQPAQREVWTDPARRRPLPLLIRWPEREGPVPLVLISHGLGGSREGLAYLGEGLAEGGFAALHLQHPGTDDGLWRGGGDARLAFAAAISDAGRALDRLLDVIFVLDELPRRPEMRGRVDTTRIGIAGHSYGAWVVQHMLGERLPGGDRGLALPDPRLSAGIALSPIPPAGLPPRLAFSAVRAPMLHVTGTRDDTWVDGTTAARRRIPFDNIAAPGALAVLEGATHASFAGEPGVGERWENPAYHGRTVGLAVNFLRALWQGDAAARAFLRGGAPGLLRPGDALETKGLG